MTNWNKLKQYYGHLLADSQMYIKLAVRIFLIGFLMGLLAVLVNQQYILEIIRSGLASIDELAETAVDLSYPEAALLIWQNNFLVVGMMIFLGFFLGYLPLVAAWSNGAVLGALCVIFTREGLAKGVLFWLSVLPHGVIEIPAFLVAAAFGIKLGWAWLLPSAIGKRLKVLNQSVYDCLAIYAGVIVLLGLAALIEAALFIGLGL